MSLDIIYVYIKKREFFECALTIQQTERMKKKLQWISLWLEEHKTCLADSNKTKKVVNVNIEV